MSITLSTADQFTLIYSNASLDNELREGDMAKKSRKLPEISTGQRLQIVNEVAFSICISDKNRVKKSKRSAKEINEIFATALEASASN